MIDYDYVDGDITSADIDGNIISSGIDGSVADEIVEGDITQDDVEGNIDFDEVEGETEGIPFLAEIDPTVPSWAKQPEKPEYEYEEILSKPSINGVTLIGNKQLEDFNIKPLTNRQILEVWNNA